jgi:hypothetical protein
MKTMTFIVQVDGDIPGVKESAQATETSQRRARWYRRNNVHCDQVAPVMGESSVEIENLRMA